MKNETNELSRAITALEEKRVFELDLLKNQFHTSYESLKPINIIKNTLEEFSSSTEIKSDMINNAISIGSGLLAKKNNCRIMDRQIDINNHKESYMVIEDFVKHHIDGIKLKKAITSDCPNCNDYENE